MSPTVSAEQARKLLGAERELSAIEDGLESLSMPSDEDFRPAEDYLF